MRVVIDGYAWIDEAALTEEHKRVLREHLTVTLPPDEGGESGEIQLYCERSGWFGVPREYYFPKRKPHHEVEIRVSEGDMSSWPGPLRFTTEKSLREEQALASEAVTTYLRAGPRGGILRAPPGWGKTTSSAHIIASMGVPTLVVVHKTFLMNQWVDRLREYLPGVKVGRIQEDVCEYKGCHVSVGMVHSLASREYPKDIYSHFGLVLVDEVHRIGARTWAPVPGRFRARNRYGITATLRRKDGAENVFRYHIGPEIFSAKTKSLPFKTRFVLTDFYLVRSTSYNGTAGRSVLIDYLTTNEPRNRLIVAQIQLAVEKGRKVMVLSERLEHLRTLHTMLREVMEGPPSIDYYIGGRSEDHLDLAAEAQVVLATVQMAAEGLDIPALDTLFLVTPVSDVEQAVGRIRRPFQGKKEPVVVDFRDDRVSGFRAAAESRMVFYRREGAA